MRNDKYFVAVLGSLLISIFLLLECKKKPEPEGIVARIDGFEITTTDFTNQFKIKYPNVPLTEATPQSKQKVLDEMVRQQLILMEAYRLGYDKDPEMINQLNEKEAELAAQEWVYLAVGQQPINNPLLREYYQLMQKRFDLFHIRLNIDTPDKEEVVKTKAKEIHRRLLKGEDFRKLAATFSEHETAANDSGKIGNLDCFGLPKPLIAKLHAMKEGEISEPIQTDDAIYLLKLEKIYPQKLADFDIVRTEIYEELEKMQQHATTQKLLKLEMGLRKKYHFTLKTPLKDFSKEALDAVLFGTKDTIYIKEEGFSIPYEFEGIIPMIRRMAEESESYALKKWAAGFLENETCPECQGSRLKKEALYFYIDDKNIAQLADMPLENLQEFIASLHTKLNDRQMQIAGDILTEIKTRIQFILDVGLGYLTLNRTAKTLSGGEAQRIRLATQIGTGLTNVLYILDEPSIGLHQRDNQRLIESLKNIRDLGNTIIVVEHDKDIMLASDYLVDIGPGCGSKGGEVVAAGPPSEVIKKDSLTGRFLSEDLKIPVPVERRKGNGKFIRLKGARGNNLKNINLEIPLGKFICVTGVSGSGKSTLIHETLYPALHNHCYRTRLPSLDYDSIEGLEHIDKVIEIDQKPIGRTPRSNPVTYIGAWGPIRDLFAILPESKIRGYKPGRFSFNVKGGRCENCSGSGYQTIQMNFLPDVNILCPVCKGMRFNRETLQVKFKGKNIHDVLEMTVDEAVEFFENQPLILSKIKILQEVGLGYLKLGQPSNTLSGGEAQRIKLSSELNKKATGKTFYIMDEPTTGLHFKDIDLLLKVIDRLVDQGNTLLVIEHNMDVIKYADYIIDLGPEGGEKGGNITFCGSPEEMISLENNYTAYYLKKELKNLNSAKHAAERTFQS